MRVKLPRAADAEMPRCGSSGKPIDAGYTLTGAHGDDILQRTHASLGGPITPDRTWCRNCNARERALDPFSGRSL